MLGFNPNNINNFYDFRLSAKIIFIVVWNILFLLEFAFVLKWDINNVNLILLDELEIKLTGFIALALILAFIASIRAQKNEKFQSFVFKPEANIEDSMDTLKFLSFVLGIMSLGFLGFTIGSYL